MKLWLSGLALMLITVSTWAGNYRVVQSPSQKLDVWIDNISDNTPQTWCKPTLTLRIVANGDKNPEVLKGFMPRLGTLLENQCSALAQVAWQLEDANGVSLAQGSAAKAAGWEPAIIPALPLTPDTPVQPDESSAPADRTPWQEFSLQDGCHLRTFWQGNADAIALFIPNGKCEKGGWLNGPADVIQQSTRGETHLQMIFVHGFPVRGLNTQVNADSLLVTTLNNERMVVSNEQMPQSWMILPYATEINGWQANGTVAVEVPRDMALDEPRLQVRLSEVRKFWSAWLTPETPLTLLLVDSLHPQLRDPAVGAWRIQK